MHMARRVTPSGRPRVIEGGKLRPMPQTPSDRFQGLCPWRVQGGALILLPYLGSPGPETDMRSLWGFSDPIAHSASAAGRVSMSRRLRIRRSPARGRRSDRADGGTCGCRRMGFGYIPTASMIKLRTLPTRRPHVRVRAGRPVSLGYAGRAPDRPAPSLRHSGDGSWKRLPC